MYITWHGHACFELGNEIKILFDPHDGKSIGLKPPIATPDIVLVSHQHFDHNAIRAIHGKFKVYDHVGEWREGDVEIKGVKAYHDEFGGRRRGEIVMFRVSMEGVNFLHTGDLGHILPDSLIAEVEPVDILFIPVGGVFTVDAKKAYRIVEKLEPKVVIPMHYRVGGLTLSINTVEPFLAMFPEEDVVHVGKSIEFEKEDLPEKLSVWVFSLD